VAELGAGAFSISPMVAGIEQLQLEYGLDTDGDGTPDTYTGAPANAAAWQQVTAVKIHVLARNVQTSGGFTDNRSYVLGLNSAGNDNVFGPYNDGYKRHAYSTVVRLDNVAGRLE
jgi:type IV pilus assembly protein PilW